MADVTKTEPATPHQPENEDMSPEPPQYTGHLAHCYPGEPARPRKWMYKSIKAGFLYIPWYASPSIQLGMVAFVCFLCPGMFNALSGLGGGGKKDPTLAANMNTALYSVFAAVGFIAGTIVNWIGIRLSIAIGGIGYCIYAISLLVSVHAYVPGFNIFAGALLGFCAGILWAAQGAIMLAYPDESKKGRYFAWFWGIFNIGACLGSLVCLATRLFPILDKVYSELTIKIALGTNIHATTNVTVNDGTYIAFIVLMGIGAILALMLVDGNKVIRSDGSKVILKKSPTLMTELVGLWETIRFDPYVVLLFPMFWSSNWFYTYQQNSVNGAYFNTRTKALNGFLYWFAQIVAAMILGPLLDIKYFRRSVRAKASLVILFVITMAIWGGGYAWQKGYTRQTAGPDSDFEGWDWTTDGFLGPMFLYFFYGMYDALWQGCVYWYMGALSNSGRRSANLVGFYKGIQSAGAAVMWSLDSNKLPYMDELASNWGLLCGSIVVAAPVIFMRIKDHVDVADDLANTGEDLDDVMPVGHNEKRPASSG